MDDINLLLLMKDAQYGQALGSALGTAYPRFHIWILKEWPEQGSFDEWQWILTDWLPCEVIGKELPEDKLLFLSENPMVSSLPADAESHFNTLYKYLGVNRLGAEIQRLHGEGPGRIPGFESENCLIAGFFGGRGKTSAALSTARELALHERKKVLYLSLETWESTPLYFPYSESLQSLGDYLYYLFAGNSSRLSGNLDSFLLRDHWGVETFSPSAGRNELQRLTEEEMGIFLDSLQVSGRYSCLILDFGQDWSAGSLLLASCCRKLFCLKDGSPLEEYRGERMKDFFAGLWGESFRDRIQDVRNFWEPIEDESLPGLVLEKDPDSFAFRNGCYYININRSFGTGVRNIADELERTI